MIIYKDGTGERVTNKAEFARKHNLNYILLLKLLKGEAKTHKGWTLNNEICTHNICSIYDVNGTKHSFSNKSAFAKEHNLNYPLLLKLLKGEAKTHKGWTLKPLDNVDMTTLYDINGIKHSFSNKSAFARKHGLSYNSLFKLLRGEVKTHKGWTLKPLSVDDTIIDAEGCERKIYNLQTFCDLYGLNAVNVRRILIGEIRSYKGWTKSN